MLDVLSARPDLRCAMRLRYHLLGGLLLCVLFPALLRNGFNLPPMLYPADVKMTVGALSALLGGYYLHRRLVGFPGVSASSYILPAFTTSFAAVIVVFFFFRLEYSRQDFLLSYSLALVWAYAHTAIGRRAQTLRLAVVPGGAAKTLEQIRGVSWDWLKEPEAGWHRWDGIVVDLRADHGADWTRFIARAALAGVPVYHFKRIRESLTGRVEIEHLSENTFGSLNPNRLYFRLKHAADFVVALLVFLPALPLAALIALAIRLDTPGPVFFVQPRLGHRGRVIRVVKFRTMRHEEAQAISLEERREHARTLPHDRRITPVGKWLRRTRLDELPQIINILRGEMSWIGPRPEALPLSAHYDDEIAFYSYRHIVRPGITGWAQVNQGHVTTVDSVRDKLGLDLYYIAYFSNWLDVLIALRTLRTIVTGFGAR
ncbi:sugar transferase [Tianweitania sediminis]|uniref:Sugar transferase n=2 Tax=Tianweitania sediminis TaxID=1502156 RepID=A0A8J7UJE2_9HYPH|nr:sugar transferase [Tianweitania sediminis]